VIAGFAVFNPPPPPPYAITESKLEFPPGLPAAQLFDAPPAPTEIVNLEPPVTAVPDLSMNSPPPPPPPTPPPPEPPPPTINTSAAVTPAGTLQLQVDVLVKDKIV
jgi:hypothetical protein